MTNRYRLARLDDGELLATLPALVRRGNENTADLLAHLAELDERGLHLDLGFPSLFAYCTESLGLCHSSAGRRIAAARVCRRFPELFDKVASGELHLSALCPLKPHLNQENAAELFEVCSNRSSRQVDELLAARFPRADVPDLIRGLPAIEPLSEGRFGVHFTADAEFTELLEQVRALARYRNPTGDLLGIMKQSLRAYLCELEKKRFAVGRKPRSPRSLTAVGTAEQTHGEAGQRNRRIPAAVAREVYLRDRRCTFVSREGKRCGSRHFLELDHIQPWAVGGESTVSNLRLRCRLHNQQQARKDFGRALVRTTITRRSERGERNEICERSEHPKQNERASP